MFHDFKNNNKIKVRHPYIYNTTTNEMNKNYVFDIEDENGDDILIKMDKVLLTYYNTHTHGNKVDMIFCQQYGSDIFDKIVKLKKHLENKIFKDTRYKMLLNSINRYDNVNTECIKFFDSDVTYVKCFTKNNSIFELNKLKMGTIVNVIVRLNNFWIKKKWYGFEMNVEQIQLDKPIYDKSLFITLAKNTVIQDSDNVRRTQLPTNCYKEDTNANDKPIIVKPKPVFRPSLNDILNARSKILKT